MKRISRRDLFTLVAVAPLMAALGRPLKPSPPAWRFGKFQAWFKYCTRPAWFDEHRYRMPIMFLRKS